MVELLCQVNAKYKAYTVVERGKPVVYARLKKALYGMVQASYLFWVNLSRELERLGFEVNPYDWCIANKDMNVKQITVMWHVDDLKISSVDKSLIDNLITSLDARFGKLKPLSVTRGAIHKYLGMTSDYSTCGKVVISMHKYINELLKEVPEDMKGVSTTQPLKTCLMCSKMMTILTSQGRNYFTISLPNSYINPEGPDQTYRLRWHF